MPRACLTTFSLHLRANLLAMDDFVTSFPSSVLRFNAERFLLKALPVDLPVRPWPIAIVTLKHRTLSPAARLFIDHVRAFANTIDLSPAAKKSA
jgi:DNA-binding transcriptional LysR family regulator